MATVAVLNVAIRATTKELTIGLRNATSALRRFSLNAGALAAKITALGVAITAIATATFTGFIARTKRTIESLAKMQLQTGINVETLNAMRFEARKLGIDIGILERSLNKFTKVLGQAAGGNTTAIKLFTDLKLSIEGLAAGGATQAFLATVDAISKLGSAAEQAAASQRIFGKAAAAILPLIQGGQERLEAMNQNLKDLGLELTQLDVTSIRQMNNAMRDLGLSFGGLVNRLTVALSPIIVVVIEKIQTWRKEMTKTGNITARVTEVAIKGFEILVKLFFKTVAGIKDMASGWAELLAVLFDVEATLAKLTFQPALAFLASTQAAAFRGISDDLADSAEAMRNIEPKEFLKEFIAAIAEVKNRFEQLADEQERRAGAIKVIPPEVADQRGSRSGSFAIEAAERGTAQVLTVLARIAGAEREAVIKQQLAEDKKQVALLQKMNQRLENIRAELKQVFTISPFQTAPF